MSPTELSMAHPTRREVFFVLWKWLDEELGYMAKVADFCGAHDMCDWITPSDAGFTIAVKKIKKLIKAYKQSCEVME